MDVFIGDLRLFKDYDIISGPFMNFVISVSPVVSADALEVIIDHGKGLYQNFSFKGDYCDHAVLADALDNMAKKLREKFDGPDDKD